MEYLVVLYPTSRKVLIDGSFEGFTNELIELEGGEYKVSLGPPANFAPKSRLVDLVRTAELNPHTIRFTPKSA